MRHFKLIHRDSGHSVPRYTTHYAPIPGARESDTEPTARELEVEDLLCRGYSQENIAALLGRSIHTISKHVLNLYRKRGVHSQVQLLLAYLERRDIFVFADERQVRPSSTCMPAEVAQ